MLLSWLSWCLRLAQTSSHLPPLPSSSSWPPSSWLPLMPSWLPPRLSCALPSGESLISLPQWVSGLKKLILCSWASTNSLHRRIASQMQCFWGSGNACLKVKKRRVCEHDDSDIQKMLGLVNFLGVVWRQQASLLSSTMYLTADAMTLLGTEKRSWR